MDDLDQGVVWSLTNDVLTPKLLEQCLADLADASTRRSPETTAERRAAILADLAEVESKLKNLVAFIERGAATDTTLGAIKGHEAAKRDLKARLEHLDDLDKAATRDAWTFEQLQGIVKDWHGYLTLSVPAGRQALRLVLTGQITVTPHGSGWRYTGKGAFGKVLAARFAKVQVQDDDIDPAEAAEEPVLPPRGTR